MYSLRCCATGGTQAGAGNTIADIVPTFDMMNMIGGYPASTLLGIKGTKKK
jgi:hypothetical protein